MAEGSNLHVVVFPWLAFGHIIPFLELAKSLAKKGHKISFLSTPRNIHRMPTIPPHLSPLINLVHLPLPAVDGLPEGAEATADLPIDKVQYLKKACDGLEPPLAGFLNEEASPRPDWVIHDFFPFWMQGITSRLGIPCAYFSVYPASTLAIAGPPSELMSREDVPPEEFTVPPKWVTFPTTVTMRLHEARDYVGLYRPNASGKSDFYRAGATFGGCQVLAIRSSPEIESNWLRLMEELYNKPVIPVGLLPPPVTEKRSDASDGTTSAIIEWLNKREPRSVVYVAFGSEAPVTLEFVRELAAGLELSELPFLWALRKSAASLPEGVEVLLPEGFEDRVGDRGLVATSWVPQLEILAHASVGGFLTHCGWSSIVEGLHFGHPLILLPVSVGQATNSRMMTEWKVGVEVPRKEEDGSFSGEEVAATLRLAMLGEEGESMRGKAMEKREIFGAERNDRYMEGFIQYLVEHKDQLRS